MTVPLVPLHCPEDETLAAFVDGKLPEEEREAFLEHLASCESCYAVWQGVEDMRKIADTGADQDDAAGRPAAPVTGRFGPGRLVASAAALAAAAALAFVFVPQLLPRRDNTELVRAAGELKIRTTKARLSIDLPYRPTRPVFRSGGENEHRLDPELAPIYQPAAEIAARAEQRRNAATLHDRGLALLLLEEPTEALRALQEAERQGEPDVQLLVDLTAAALAAPPARGREAEQARLALQYATRAWQKAQTPATAWNRALALEKAERGDEAIDGWRAYQQMDPRSQWTVEAGEHIARLTETLALPNS